MVTARVKPGDGQGKRHGPRAFSDGPLTEGSFIFPVTQAKIRTIMKDGNPWFVAKDVCDILEIGNPTKALYGLDEDEKNTLTISKGTSGNPTVAIISESGFYSIVGKSRKPQAEVFKRWVNHDVNKNRFKWKTRSLHNFRSGAKK